MTTARRTVVLWLAALAVAIGCVISGHPGLAAGALAVPVFGVLLTDDHLLSYFIKLGVADARGLFHAYMQTREVTFTETTGAGTYTALFVVPAGATMVELIVTGVTLWAAATSATLKAGFDGSFDTYFTGVDLKATDLLAGEQISLAGGTGAAGGKAGTDVAASQWNRRYSATARTYKVIVTTVGASGAAGVTRVTAIFSAPATVDVVAATKV